MSDPTFRIAKFLKLTGTEGLRVRPADLTWDELAALLGRHSRRAAKEGWLWSGVRYIDGETTRAAKNVVEATLAVADFDSGVSPEELRPKWDAAGLAYLIHSSHGHTDAVPKWRAVFPLSKPVPAAEWPETWRRLNASLWRGLVDPACKDICRAYYLPSAPPETWDARFAVRHDGRALLPTDYPAPAAPTPAPRTPLLNRSESVPDHDRRPSPQLLLNRAVDDARGGKGRNHAGFDLAGQLRDNEYSQAQAEAVLEDFSDRVTGLKPDPYPREEALKSVASAYSRAPREPWGPPTIETRSVYMPARAAARHASEAAEELPEPPPEEAPARCFKLTEYGNAERLIAQHGQNLRYCRKWRSWLIWDGRRWAIDERHELMRLAKATVRNIYAEAAAAEDSDRRAAIAKFAAASEKAASIAAMIKLAESEPGVSITPDELDRDPNLLCCLTGVIDLRTGKLRSHRREDLISKLAPANYSPGGRADRPVFERFLARVLPDAETRGFVQRAMGYSVTGDTGEEVLFMPYGSGRNGKGKLMEAVQRTLGDYATTTRPETFIRKPGVSIPNDVAALAGARLVCSSEVEEGVRLDVQLVKSMTGGDRMQARFLHAEYFTFKPFFKIWFAVNHRPVIRDTTVSIWERVKVIPFNVFIPEEERDKSLETKLAAEVDGILHWLIEGCLEWRRTGLREPDAVRLAVSDYREEMDVLASFFAERCVLGADRRSEISAVYAAYLKWCQNNGETALKETPFGKKVAERGIGKARTKSKRFYTGIGLLDSGGRHEEGACNEEKFTDETFDGDRNRSFDW